MKTGHEYSFRNESKRHIAKIFFAQGAEPDYSVEVVEEVQEISDDEESELSEEEGAARG